MALHPPANRHESPVSGASAWSDDDISRAARARLAAIVDSSDDAIISKNTQGIITSWNAAAERLFGYTAEEMIGTSILKIIPFELRGEEDMILGKIRRGERVEHFETTRVRKDGKTVKLSITVSPVHDDSGRVIGASKIARDISDQTDLS